MTFTTIMSQKKRLIELYPLKTAVYIKLGEQWMPGVIIRHEHPAVWVQTEDGRSWFVTNGRRIKRRLEE